MDTGHWSPIARSYDPLKAGSIDATDLDPHDNGIIRSLNAKYKPNKDVVGDPHKTLFIARLNPKTSEETLESVFSEYGEIERIRLVRDIVTGHSKCYAFVEYVQEKAAVKAELDGNKLEIDGCEIFVDFECERTLKGWIPRRLGGGLGGKKESGQLRFGGKDRPFRRPIEMDNFPRESGEVRRRGDRDMFDSRDSRDNRTYNRRRDRSKSRDRLRDHSKLRSRGHSRDRSRGHSRDRSRGHSKDRSRGHSRDRSRGHSRDRSRKHGSSRSKDENSSYRKHSRRRSHDRSRSPENSGSVSRNR